ncbi:iron chelate uptake ABC transporter family permease subunit [Celerinatantimonas sp. MCCC 1A17872]|uniref:iron chelate uptake ABC transporter family permease subunit n=1 Tax=Celerinatantimonas sp. MCCC 1A17872 TaxID=3177514 RepID=UPI0038C563C1
MNKLSLWRFTHAQRLMLLMLLGSLSAVGFVFFNPSTLNDFIIHKRMWMLLTMVIVAIASGSATLIFQTLTNNRILSPSVMGFESLFVLVQSALVFFFSINQRLAATEMTKFALEVILMVALTLILYYRLLFKRKHNGLYLLVLTGIVCGALFQGLATLLQRLLSPSDFAIVQSQMFARFSMAAPRLVIVSTVVTALCLGWLWRQRHILNLLSLGRQQTILLGENWRNKVFLLLSVTSLLVAIATALIGPLAFFGFLSATLSYQFMQTYRHEFLLPAVMGIGLTVLCLSQLILAHLLEMSGSLSVVIEFMGGLVFLYVLLRYKTT